MRSGLVLVFASGCLWELHEIVPARTYDARLTYDGEQTSATISFPSYPRSEHPDVIGGTVEGATITSARIELADSTRRYTIEVARKPGDDAFTGPVECVLEDDDIGHATGCTKTNKSCSIVMVAR